MKNDMVDFNFKKWNVILGWVVFIIALTTYWLTVEPTASFWDAGEYITTASNLEVGHPPGAPLYQILGAFFSIFASGAENIALTVNLMSVFASAFTILFLFWTITILLQNILSKNEDIKANKAILILGSAAVGSLAFTYTDSFWFSALEAEVYAMASCLMAILFYLGLRWEHDMHTPRGNRWVILIAFVIGLSFGVHFMSLLTIPAIGFLYFFKNYEKVTIKNFIIANFVVVGALLFIFLFLLPMSMRFFSASELFFVNSIGLPFNSGTIIAALLIIAAFYFLLRYTRNKNYVKLNTLVLCILFIFIGFSNWIMLPIRANAGTVINENKPSDAQELLAYYNREQYGENPLLYGPQFTEMYAGIDKNNSYRDEKINYERDLETKKYVIVNNYKSAIPNYDDSHKTFLPRMWSAEHADNYIALTEGIEFKIKREYLDQEKLVNEVSVFKNKFQQGEIDSEDYHGFLTRFGEYLDIEKPSFLQNMRYMFQYQFGYMYWRYFMWNFTGKQDDIQGKNDNFSGNWISGIKFVDEARLGSQENLPSDVLNNKGRNTYYFLPLILGILGIVFHYNKDKSSFWVLTVFFLFTGIALKVYLNERPFEPRERDYALVGSFYVFAIWIGFGIYALYEMIKKYLQPKIAIPLVLVVGLLAAPILLASQNWDDHDRSDRYTARAMAKKYLDSMDKNGIVFTIGDNDTFALWYAQNVEKYRTDIRVINTSLFNTDWYINDMRKKAFESDPIPLSFTPNQYRGSKRQQIMKHPYVEVDDTISLERWINWIATEDPRTTLELQNGQFIYTFPSKKIRIPVDKDAVLRNGIVNPKDADLIVPYIDIEIKADGLLRNRFMMLDIINNNNWERPIYFSAGSFGDDDYLWMKEYLQLDGLVYKLVPIKTNIDKRNPFDMGRIDSEKMFEIVMKWDWGNSGSPDIYHDPETRKNSISYRSNLARLAEKLILEEKLTKAEQILDLAMKNMPVEYYEYYTLLEPYVSGYFEVGKEEKAVELYDKVAKKYQERLIYYSGLSYALQSEYIETIYMDIERYRSLLGNLLYSKNDSILKSRADDFNRHLKLFNHFFPAEEETLEKARDSINDTSDTMNEETFLRLMDSLEQAKIE